MGRNPSSPPIPGPLRFTARRANLMNGFAGACLKFFFPTHEMGRRKTRESEGTAVLPIPKESERKARFYSLCPAGAEEKNTRIRGDKRPMYGSIKKRGGPNVFKIFLPISFLLSSNRPPRESHEWIRGGVPSERKVELRSRPRKWHAIFGGAISDRIKKPRGTDLRSVPRGIFLAISFLYFPRLLALFSLRKKRARSRGKYRKEIGARRDFSLESLDSVRKTGFPPISGPFFPLVSSYSKGMGGNKREKGRMKEKSWICLCPFGALDKSVIAQKIACDFLSELRFFLPSKSEETLVCRRKEKSSMKLIILRSFFFTARRANLMNGFAGACLKKRY